MTPVRRAMVLLAAGGFVSGATIRIAEPLLPKVAEDLGVTASAAAVLITAFTLAYGCFQLVHGPMGDRFGRLRVVSVAMVLAGLACAACATAADLRTLALYRFLTGVTAGAVVPLSFAYVGDNVPFERRQAALGRFISGILLGQIAGPLLGGLLADHLGWRATFLVPAAGFLAIGALLALLGRESLPALAGERLGVIAVYRSLLASPTVRALCLFVGMEGCLFYGAFAFLGAYLRESFALSYTLIGVYLTGFGAGGVLYTLLVRWMVRRLGPPAMVAGGGWILLACFGAIAGSAWPEVNAACIVVAGLGFYMMHNTLQTRATEMAPQARGAAISLFAFALFAGQAAGVAGSGLAIDNLGYGPTFVVTGAGLAATALTFSSWLRRGASTGPGSGA